jgi:hypothetical protein
MPLTKSIDCQNYGFRINPNGIIDDGFFQSVTFLKEPVATRCASGWARAVFVCRNLSSQNQVISQEESINPLGVDNDFLVTLFCPVNIQVSPNSYLAS